jgi:hypothetical protein
MKRNAERRLMEARECGWYDSIRNAKIDLENIERALKSRDPYTKRLFSW